MAISIMGGLVVATALTLVFVPALYATWFRVRRESPAKALTIAPTTATA
jgi:Cu/Ag efflux pump CusA